MGRTAARWQAWEKRGGPVALAGPLSPVTYPQTRLRHLVEIAPGADLTADPATWSWVDITRWVRHDMGVSTVVGRRDQAGIVDPSRATLKLDNRDSRFSRRNPLGPYYGQLTRNTPIRMAVDPGSGMAYRYHGFVNEWPKAWNRRGNDSTVTITCGGALRRLSRSATSASPLFRSFAGFSPNDAKPQAYWSMEDGADSRRFASGLPGGEAMTVGGQIELSTSDVVAGSLPLPVWQAGSNATGVVPTHTDLGTWSAQAIVVPPADLVTQNQAVTVFRAAMRGGAYSSISVAITPGQQLGLVTRDLNGTVVDSWFDTFPTGSVLGEQVSVSVTATRDASGSNDGWSANLINADGEILASIDQVTGTGDYGQIDRVIVNGQFALATDVVIGHMGVWVDGSFTPGVDDVNNARAIGANAGEQAHERMIRVCREEGIALRCVAGRSPVLGPQPTGTALEIMRDAEKAALGVLYEYEFGLGYKAQTEFYNQPVQLPLDFALRHIGDPPNAVDSDLKFRNQWTVSRRDGSSATVRDPNYNGTEGLVPGSTIVNLGDDAQLIHAAGWYVHRDTVDEDYWTGIKLRFHSTPDLIPAWVSLPFGSRMTAVNQPDQADPGGIDAIIEGWAEYWDIVKWEATLNTSPARVFRVGVYNERSTRYNIRDTVLAEDLDTTETAVDITVPTSSRGWITTALHPTKFPFDLGIGGEQMTVTASVDNGGGQYAFTVTRSVNGIVKTHTAGASAGLWEPAVYAF